VVDDRRESKKEVTVRQRERGNNRRPVRAFEETSRGAGHISVPCGVTRNEKGRFSKASRGRGARRANQSGEWL
jgi:hypothetical protein